MKKRKMVKVLAIDLILIVGSLIAVGVLVSQLGDSGQVMFSPAETGVLFEFEASDGDVILMADNLEFASAEEIVVFDGRVIYFDVGTYYWKIEGEGFARRFNFDESVELMLRKSARGYEVVNADEGDLLVEISRFGEDVGNIILAGGKNA